MTAPLPPSRHADLMDAHGFWRQFVVAYYFDTPGDQVVGTVIKFWSEGRPTEDAAPCLRLQTKDGRRFDITAHQERLKAELVKAAPAKGDQVRITYTGEAEKAAPGFNKAKLFTVEVKRLPDPRAPERSENGSEPTTESATENESEPGKKPKSQTTQATPKPGETGG